MKDYKSHADFWLSGAGENCKEGDVCLINGEKHQVVMYDINSDFKYELTHIEQ